MNSNRTECRPFRIPLCWILLIVLDLTLAAFTLAQEFDSAPNGRQPDVVMSVETDLAGPTDLAEDAVRFEAIDVFVDSGDQTLAAWQLELSSMAGDARIVGIEGGEHPAYATPPYYDPKAMKSNRVIIGAFSQNESLPSGRCRVARIHVQLTGPGSRLWKSELTTSATAGGEKIPASVSIANAKG